jgi:hypothetical protein
MLKFAESPTKRCLPVEVVIGDLLRWHGKQRKHATWLKNNRKCVNSAVHDQVNPPKRLSADESDGVSILYTAPIKSANFVRHTEGELDGLWASGRDRLQRSSTGKLSLDLVVVPDEMTQSRRGAGAEHHAAQLTSLLESAASQFL